MLSNPTDFAFSDSVKEVQQRKGSRGVYAGVVMSQEIHSGLAGFIAERNSFYLATASADGQPYIQHRGGPKGFLKVLDERTLAFADFKGNQQFISTGNLAENPKVYLFLIDYAQRQRIKIWGEAEVIENDPALLRSLMPEDYRASGEQVIKIRVNAWDVNCPQHITQKFDGSDVLEAVQLRDKRIEELEKEIKSLKAELNK